MRNCLALEWFNSKFSRLLRSVCRVIPSQVFERAGERFSLSRRERAGVREKSPPFQRGHGFSFSALIRLALLLYAASPGAFAQDVTLTDNGTTVTLANGIVSLGVTKSSGKCTDLRLAGGSNVLANGGQLYFDANGSTGTNASAYYNFSPDSYRVVTNTAVLAEIAFADRNLTGFNAELHYVLRAGDRGFYLFIVWRHGAGDPVCMLEQSRTVLRCDPNVFVRAYASTNKLGQMISPALLVASKPTITDATYKLPLVSSYTNATGYTDDGYPVYSKYDWAEYTENHALEGLTSETNGLWLLFGGKDYFNGGPTRANLILHGTETTPLLLWDFHAQHFGGAKIYLAANQVWSKLVGPAFVYLNAGTNSDQLWQDAQARAALEQAAWPCAWMTDPDYPVARGAVAGQLHILGESCRHALLVLAAPGDYWQLQSEGYQFWTRAAADGSFLIPKIRPGSYTLYGRVPGIIGEFSLGDVTVAAGQTNDLGWLDWHPPRREQRLWRVGTPDLSAGEFRWGDQLRQFGLWWRYLEEQGTNDLIYRAGRSAATNWYYAQSVAALDDGTYHSPKWVVEFVLTNLPPAPVVLTVDLAGGIGGTLAVAANTTSLGSLTITNDAGIYRSATQSGLFRHFEIGFSPAALQLGTNTVSFLLSKSSSWTGTKPVTPNRGVMYDCVQLEAGDLLAGIAPQIAQIRPAGGGVAISGAGGFPDATYQVLAATRLAPADWTPVATNRFDGLGGFSFTNSGTSGAPRFFRVLVP